MEEKKKRETLFLTLIGLIIGTIPTLILLATQEIKIKREMIVLGILFIEEIKFLKKINPETTWIYACYLIILLTLASFIF